MNKQQKLNPLVNLQFISKLKRKLWFCSIVSYWIVLTSNYLIYLSVFFFICNLAMWPHMHKCNLQFYRLNKTTKFSLNGMWSVKFNNYL